MPILEQALVDKSPLRYSGAGVPRCLGMISEPGIETDATFLDTKRTEGRLALSVTVLGPALPRYAAGQKLARWASLP